jgi:propanol-preferring alcohol dehydrogenase
MKAQVLHQPKSVNEHPLAFEDAQKPDVPDRHLLVHVRVCGVCHTDLHVVEGELDKPKLPLIPGHQVVGTVEAVGAGVTRFPVGARVGIPWLHDACGVCEFCQRGQENLCPYARFTGYTADGGYAEYATIREDFAVALPESFTDVEVAPLLCAGIVGYRALKLAEIQPGERVGLYGFGSSAHLCLQVLKYWGCEVYAFSRGAAHQQLARELGASWAGESKEQPPKPLDRAVSFAPVGSLVPVALGHLRPGGTLCINAVHASPIPEFPYDLLWGERTVRTVANATRRDADEFMALAAQIPIRAEIEQFALKDANIALERMKQSDVRASAVLIV